MEQEEKILTREQQKNCPKCGRANLDEAIFCSFCGKKLIREKAQQKTKSRGNGQGSAFRRGKTWTACVTYDWKDNPVDKKHPIPIRKTKGGFKTKGEALEYCPTLKALALNKGPVEKPRYTLKQLYDMWEPWYEPRVKNGSMAGYKSAFKHFSALNDKMIDEICADDLQQCMDDCTSGKRTHQMMKVTAGLLWAYAYSKDLVPKKITEDLYTGKGQSKKREPITEEELKVIRSHLQDNDPYVEYVYSLCYLGFRPGEMLELKKDQLHEKKNILYFIAGKKTEAGKDRIVTIPDQIRNVILHRKEIPGTDLMFPMYVHNLKGEFTGYKEMTDNYFREFVFKPMMERFGIAKGKVPYGARHTYSNKLKKAKGDPKDKAALIGHSDYTFTQTQYQEVGGVEDLNKITKTIK